MTMGRRHRSPQEPEQQPGDGRTRLGLLWRWQSSERWLLPGFVNVGQCSHTPTEMALFSKIQPARTALRGVPWSWGYRTVNAGVTAAGFTHTLAGRCQPLSCPPQPLLNRSGAVFFRGDNAWGGKSTRFCGKPSCQRAGYPARPSTMQPLRETPLDSLAPSCSPPSLELSGTGTQLALPRDQPARGPTAPPRGRALGAGSSPLGSCEAKQQHRVFLPGPFMGEQPGGRAGCCW